VKGRKAPAFLICALLGLPAFAQIGRGVVTGQIRTPAGGPAAGLRVAAVEASDSGRSARTEVLMASIAETDSEGRFRLEDIPPGRYHIVAGRLDAPTYYPGARGVSNATTVTVAAGATISGIDFSAVAPLKVTGRIVGQPAGMVNASTAMIRLIPGEPSSNPALPNLAPSVFVFGGNLFSGPPGLVSPISADGSFEFGDVPSGPYTLQYTGPSVRSSIQYPILVRDRNVTDLVVAAPGTVFGHVVVDQGGPVPAFNLTFVDSRSPSIAIPISSFSIWPSFVAQLPGGDYLLDLSDLPRGYSVKSMTYGGRDALRAPLTIGDAPDEVVVTLKASNPPPWVKVSGRVTGPGSPAGRSGTELTLHDAFTHVTTSAALQADGTFQFERVLPGVYEARFDPAPEGVNPIEVFVPDRDLTGIEIRLPGRVRVTGRVTANDNSTPPVQILVAGLVAPEVTPEVIVGFAERDLTIGRDGAFSAILPEGDYDVAVIGVRAPYSIRSFTRGADDLLTGPLKVRERESESVLLALSIPVFAIRGHVYSADAAGGIDPVRLTLSEPLTASVPLSIQPGAGGAFELTVPSGDYTLRIDPAGAAFRVVVNGADIENLDFTLLRGRATMTSGARVPPGMTVWFSSTADSLGASAGSDGTFVTALPPGGYRVVPDVPPGYVVKSFTAGPADLMEGTMTVGAKTGEELRLVLEPRSSARVRGRVIGSEHAKQPLRVELVRTASFERFEAPVRPDGSFEISVAPQGQYQLQVPPELAVTRASLIEVNGDIDGAAVEIRPQFPIGGRVIVENGEGLPDVSSMVVKAWGEGFSAAGSVRPDGTFSFSSIGGEQRIMVDSLPAGYGVKSVTPAAINLPEDVAADSRKSIEIVLFRRR
jgi:hypothetical protein